MITQRHLIADGVYHKGATCFIRKNLDQRERIRFYSGYQRINLPFVTSAEFIQPLQITALHTTMPPTPALRAHDEYHLEPIFHRYDIDAIIAKLLSGEYLHSYAETEGLHD